LCDYLVLLGAHNQQVFLHVQMRKKNKQKQQRVLALVLSLCTEVPTLAILTTTGKHQFLVFLDLEEKLKESAGARTVMVKIL
jgi:hypothetical protein